MDKKEENKMQGLLSEAHHDYNKGLNARAYFKVNNHATSDDLVQDTFSKTWSYLLRGGKIDIMKSFLYHILNNLIVDEYRKRKTSSLDLLLEEGYEPSVDNSERDINILDGKVAINNISLLPFKYQRIMRLRHVQMLTLGEISLLVGQSKSTLAVQLHRGLAKLKLLTFAHQGV